MPFTTTESNSTTESHVNTTTRRSTVQTDWSNEYDTTRNGKLFRRVNVDPRSVAFIIGRNHGNLRKMGCNVKDQSGKSIYIKYIQPERYQWGFFKLTSESAETLDLGERLLKAKEAEFLKLFQEGRLAPAYNREESKVNTVGKRFDGISNDTSDIQTNYKKYHISNGVSSSKSKTDDQGWTVVSRK